MTDEQEKAKARCGDLESEVSQGQAQLTEANEAHEETRRVHTVLMDTVLAELEEAKGKSTALESDLAREKGINNETTLALDALETKQKETLLEVESTKMQMEQLGEEHASERKARDESHAADLASAEEKRNELEEAHQQMAENAKMQIKQLGEEHSRSSKARDEIHAKTLALAQGKYDDLETTHQQMKVSNEEILKDARKAADDALSQTKLALNALAAAQKELEDERESWEKERGEMESNFAESLEKSVAKYTELRSRGWEEDLADSSLSASLDEAATRESKLTAELREAQEAADRASRAAASREAADRATLETVKTDLLDAGAQVLRLEQEKAQLQQDLQRRYDELKASLGGSAAESADLCAAVDTVTGGSLCQARFIRLEWIASATARLHSGRKAYVFLML